MIITWRRAATLAMVLTASSAALAVAVFTATLPGSTTTETRYDVSDSAGPAADTENFSQDGDAAAIAALKAAEAASQYADEEDVAVSSEGIGDDFPMPTSSASTLYSMEGDRPRDESR